MTILYYTKSALMLYPAVILAAAPIVFLGKTKIQWKFVYIFYTFYIISDKG